MNKSFRKGDILEAKRDFLVMQEIGVCELKPYTLNKGDRIVLSGQIGGNVYFKEFLPFSDTEFVAKGIIPKHFKEYMPCVFEKIGILGS